MRRRHYGSYAVTHGSSPHPHLHEDRRHWHDRARRRHRVPKTDPRIEAYADVDETNAAIGVVLALGEAPREIIEILRSVQNDLFDVGADLCTPISPDPKYPPLRITEAYVTRLEGWCDEFNARLTQARLLRPAWWYPGRGPAARGAHGRRRAERRAWALWRSNRTAPTRSRPPT